MRRRMLVAGMRIPAGYSALLLSIWLAMAAISAAHAGSLELTNADIAARVDAIGKEAIASGKVPGLVIAVAHRDRVLVNRAYGKANIELDVAMTPDSVLRIGSVTKQFAAAGILLLAEQGKLSLEDKLSKYFPEFPRGSEVTMRQLLNHTAGVHSFTASKAIPSEIFSAGTTVPEFVKRIATLGYDFDPGTHYAYSNSGYYLIGAIIEQVSGMTFRDFSRERLFLPAGMTDTAVDLNEEIVPRRAAGYQGGRDPGKFLNAGYTHMSVPFAAGAMRSTTADLVRWNAALHGGKLLGPASLREMTTPSRRPEFENKQSAEPPTPSSYGLGLRLGEQHGHAMISHAGSIDGFGAYLAWFPDEGLTLVMLTNTLGGSAGLAERLMAALFADHPETSRYRGGPQPYPADRASLAHHALGQGIGRCHSGSCP